MHAHLGSLILTIALPEGCVPPALCLGRSLKEDDSLDKTTCTIRHGIRI